MGWEQHPSVKRSEARGLQQREAAVLDNFARLRELREDAHGEAGAEVVELAHYQLAGAGLGLDVRGLCDPASHEFHGVYDGDRLIGVLHISRDGGSLSLYPTERLG